ncbi:hypothetical protein LX64_04153 [Chitinophaga skermanii]|uniref:Uncharacterized protein n=1 Tax=Chitinophaga skermanii TaxID=331697 RepID=A0A327QFI7_9BACT|nr:hypothetical protein [Chitinophaga skermanii]RAJ00447.1 hypothetical protein LX64_04153 [Chitinophaga skermanii]
MLHLNIDNVLAKLNNFKDSLSDKKLRLALASTLNKSALQLRTTAKKIINSEYKITQSSLDKSIVHHKAFSNTLEASILANSESLTLKDFSPKFTSHKEQVRLNKNGSIIRRKRKAKRKARRNVLGVSVEIHKGKRILISYAFMIPSNAHVYARGWYSPSGGFEQRTKREQKTGSDLKITKLLSISIYSTVVNKNTMEVISKKSHDVVPNILLHELKYRLATLEK